MLNVWFFMSWASSLHPRRFYSCALIVGFAATAVGCAQVSPFTSEPVDAASPMASAVSSAANTSLVYPKFDQIPPAPTDVRGPRAWRRAVVVILRDKSVIETMAEANPASLFNPESFAKKARAQAAIKPGDETPNMTRQDTEAFAKAMRERATPPPPPQ